MMLIKPSLEHLSYLLRAAFAQSSSSLYTFRAMSAKFSTHILDRALAQQRQRREHRRRVLLEAAFTALAELSQQIAFEEAYLFGSITQPERFSESSDVDIAFVGLRDEDFFRALAFLSRRLAMDVDIVQLEKHPRREQILQGGIRWTKPAGPS
jgi:predicted nucleotidyltransferase